MKDIKFVILIILIFFGAGIMANINDYDYNVNKTGIMYQENDNIVLNEINRFYDYDIDFNLDESYLQYSPVKKGGLLDSLYSDKSKNLAMPDLTGKDYLGDGEYLFYKNGDFEIFYNVNSGYFEKKTLASATRYIGNFGIEYNKDYVYQIIGSGISGLVWFNSTQTETIWTTNQPININISTGIIVGFGVSKDFIGKFKIHLEKGSTATPYEVPYIPALQIVFNGTNQVEYINPFVEQIIEINDINNVNNIDFQLLNTKNPAVFNWNITTNPNMPFVRFYNNQTKLLYDFTDIKEINNIGNEILGTHSNFMIVFDSAINTVDMFYTGFQKLFNKSLINTIKNGLKKLWPIITPDWPWLR